MGKVELKWQGKILPKLPQKALALLCYLSLSNKPISREDMATLLWGPGKLNNLRQAVHKIRKLEAAEKWFVDDEELEVRAKTDIAEFQDLIANGEFEKAINLFDEGLLSGFELQGASGFMDWLELEQIRMRDLYEQALRERLSQLEKESSYLEALKLAKEIISKDQLNETIHQKIMLYEYKLGNIDAALEQFEKLRQTLKQEMSIEPLPETLDLLQEIEQGANQLNTAKIINDIVEIPHLPKRLIGRNKELKKIKQILEKDKSLLVQGFGGAGKTAIVATVAKEYLKGASVLWLEHGAIDYKTALSSILYPLEISQKNKNEQELRQGITDALQSKKIKLLVLDDIWNAYSLSKLLEILPPSLTILASSRQRYPGIKRLTISNLERKNAIKLVEHYAGRKLNNAAKLCEYFGDHAFALKVAAITIKQENLKSETLLKRIRKTPIDLRIPKDLADGPNSLAALLSVSLEALSDRAYEVFLAFGVIKSLSASAELISYLIDRGLDLVETELFELLNRGLLERISEPGSDAISYKIHNLSHSYLKFINNIRNKSYVKACTRYLENHTDEPEFIDVELDNIIAAAESADDEKCLILVKMLVLQADYFAARGHNTRSLRLLKKAIQISKANDDLSSAQELLSKIGNTYTNFIGDNDKALSSYKEALKYARLSNNLSREAILLNVIGVMYFYQKDERASSYFAKAIAKASESKDDLSLATILEQQAYIEGLQGNHKQAKKDFIDALAAVQRLRNDKGSDNKELLKREFFAIFNLGQALHDLKEFKQAIEKRNTALLIAKEEDSELWMALCYFALGESYHALNKPNKSKDMLKQALEIYEKNRAFKYIKSLKEFMSANNISLN